MNLKYYLRGIGVGILFTAVVMSVAFRILPGKELSDAQIKERASKLGMVDADSTDPLKDLLSTPTATEAPSETPAVTETPAATETPAPTETPEATKTPSSEGTQSPSDTSKEAEGTKDTADKNSNTQPSSGENTTDEKEAIEITITKGMTSEKVSKLLKEKGIIEDSDAFNQYLVINNYTRSIRVGKYQFKTYAPYKDITDMIIRK